MTTPSTNTDGSSDGDGDQELTDDRARAASALEEQIAAADTIVAETRLALANGIGLPDDVSAFVEPTQDEAREQSIESFAASMETEMPPLEGQERRRADVLVALSGVLSSEDFLEALEALADRVRNVQQFENKPRHGERSLSALTMAEDILRALQLAIGSNDAELLKGIHERSVAGIRNKAIAIHTGVAVRMKRGFGQQLVLLLESTDGLHENEVAARIADAAIWRDCPVAPQLRSLNRQHRFLMPRVESWVAKEWSARRQGLEAGKVHYADLGRSLLRALGVDEQEARNALKA